MLFSAAWMTFGGDSWLSAAHATLPPWCCRSKAKTLLTKTQTWHKLHTPMVSCRQPLSLVTHLEKFGMLRVKSVLQTFTNWPVLTWTPHCHVHLQLGELKDIQGNDTKQINLRLGHVCVGVDTHNTRFIKIVLSLTIMPDLRVILASKMAVHFQQWRLCL